MKKAEKTKYLSMLTIAYFSGYGGIEIKEIVYGIEDYAVYVAGAWTNNKTVHRSKIYFYGDDIFFKYHGAKISLNDCIRTNI